MKHTSPNVIVVGAGLSGLMAALHLAESGVLVTLISRDPPVRSDSSALHLPFAAAVGGKGGRNSPEKHFLDTVASGDFLANQEPVRQFCFGSPSLFSLLQRMGVFFNRGDDGYLETCESEGWHHSASFKGDGKRILQALDGQIRLNEEGGKISRRFGWEFLSAILDDSGICRGVVAMDSRSMKCEAFRSGAVVMATGGLGALFGQNAQGTGGDGAAVSVLYQQGAPLANPEMIQFQPSIPLTDSKSLSVGAQLVSHGARFFTYRNGARWYFLEELYPRADGALPHSVTCRTIDRVGREMGLGFKGSSMVCLEVPKRLEGKLAARWGVLWESVKRMVTSESNQTILPVLPSVSYWLGGLWTDENQMTAISGLFAVGECQYQFHVANLLEGNVIPVSLFSGWKGGEAAASYLSGVGEGRDEPPPSLFDKTLMREKEMVAAVREGTGKESLPLLTRELQQGMTAQAGLARKNGGLKEVDEKIVSLSERSHKITLADHGPYMNNELREGISLRPRLDLCRAIARAALLRNETRGCHDKPEYPKRDDGAFLKSSKVYWTPDGPRVEYEDVNIKYVKP